MKVRYNVSAAGIDFIIRSGDVREVSDEEGKRLCSAGICTPVKRTTRKATVKPDETR